MYIVSKKIFFRYLWEKAKMKTIKCCVQLYYTTCLCIPITPPCCTYSTCMEPMYGTPGWSDSGFKGKPGAWKRLRTSLQRIFFLYASLPGLESIKKSSTLAISILYLEGEWRDHTCDCAVIYVPDCTLLQSRTLQLYRFEPSSHTITHLPHHHCSLQTASSF